MTLEVTFTGTPSIRVTDALGHETLNTAEKLFYARAVDRIQASITTSVYDTGTTVTVDHTLGTVASSASFIRGSLTVTGYPSTGVQMQGAPINRRFNAGGTYVHVCTSLVMHTFTPFLDGTTVKCREKLVSVLQQNSFGQTFQVGGVSIDFDLICGQFT